ncbi:MAG: hypothetical protein CMJ45_14130 [Planctomyces sp.]|nr:hypothetical protein [Planctomyces sp.]
MLVLLFGSLLAGVALACGGTPTPGASTESIETPTPIPTATGNIGRDIARGKRIAREKGCLGCHTTDGRDQVGPTWKGLYGKPETLVDAGSVKVDEGYLKESIVDPNAQLVQGFPPNIMPGLDLAEGEVDAIIAYIRSLR